MGKDKHTVFIAQHLIRGCPSSTLMMLCLSWWFIVFLQHIWNILPFSWSWQFLSIFSVSERYTETGWIGSVLAWGQVLLSGTDPACLVRLVSTEWSKPNGKLDCKSRSEACYFRTLSIFFFSKKWFEGKIHDMCTKTHTTYRLRCKGYVWKYKPSNWRLIKVNNEWIMEKVILINK